MTETVETTVATIGMTGYCHRGDHRLCPHTDGPVINHPSCACSCHRGVTGYCLSGRHETCPYRAGGALYGGIVLSAGDSETRYSCPCECHGTNKEKEKAVTATAELEVYDPVEGELIEPPKPLTKTQAKNLDKKIRATSDKLSTTVNTLGLTLYELLEQASEGRIHEALGYASWTAWYADAVQYTPSDRIERKALVELMSGKGMSQRKIADTLGVSQKTVDRDLEGVESDEGSTVTTSVGKTYPKNKGTKVIDPKPEANGQAAGVIDAEVVDAEVIHEGEPEPVVSTPATVAEEFDTEINNLMIDTQALVDVVADEVWGKSRKRIAKANLNDLQGVIATLTEIVDDLMSA